MELAAGRNRLQQQEEHLFLSVIDPVRVEEAHLAHLELHPSSTIYISLDIITFLFFFFFFFFFSSPLLPLSCFWIRCHKDSFSDDDDDDDDHFLHLSLYYWVDDP